MRKKRNEKQGYSKILDAWVPSDDAGDPVGCVATSFTFSPILFEEECLSRFLQLQSDAGEDGPAYLIEREEKFSQLMCAAALIDQHHARGVRSLRWDMLPARPKHGILHAKVSLLLWSRHARLIVASANLTEDGYRRNQEIFGVLDYFDGSTMPLMALDDILDFLREAARTTVISDHHTNPSVQRWEAFLDRVAKVTRTWGVSEVPRSLSNPRIIVVTTGPGRESVFNTLRKQWPRTGPPRSAAVVSPFFDPPSPVNAPACELWELLRKRGDACLEFYLTAEDVPGEKAVFLHAPESLMTAMPASRPGVETDIWRLVLEEGRPLHAKCLWLENDSISLLMMGSSNFTSAGLGLGETKNLEINLAYVVSHHNRDALKALNSAWLPGEIIPDDIEWRWQPRIDEGEDCAHAFLVALPTAFCEANFGRDERHRYFLEFTFSGAPPMGWMLHVEDEREAFLTEDDWNARGRPELFRISWERERAPSGFSVSWPGSNGYAWWPVNVLNASALPPPAELKDLPLEALIESLTSARPLHQALARWLGRQPKQTGAAPLLDPHKRVNTSGFLLQRTRRVSDALRAMRLRLERPAVSEQALNWRLRGPIGVLALAQAIGKEAHSDEERCFLLTELCLELTRVKPQTAPGSLSTKRVRAALIELRKEIRVTISLEELARLPMLAAYVQEAFEEASK
ncbi:MAG: hypothetical protein IPM55_16370 [Acidobacteria bacterium]|nr:hypothetical protein [Acidobacteriota bacterium]